MNDVAIVIIMIWICSAIVSLNVENSEPIHVDAGITFCIGIGYIILKIFVGN